jgi:hypothetical protein
MQKSEKKTVPSVFEGLSIGICFTRKYSRSAELRYPAAPKFKTPVDYRTSVEFKNSKCYSILLMNTNRMGYVVFCARRDPRSCDRKTGKRGIFGHSGRGLPPIQYSNLLAPKERALLPFTARRLRSFARDSVRAANRYSVTTAVRSKFEIFDHPVHSLGPNIFEKNKRLNISHPPSYLSLNYFNTTARG